jgi:hypothetical protein
VEQWTSNEGWNWYPAIMAQKELGLEFIKEQVNVCIKTQKKSLMGKKH